MKKLGIVHALITAIIFTILYAFLITSDPGPGFHNSIASLDLTALLGISLGVYFALFFAMRFLSSFLEKFLKSDSSEVSSEYLAYCCLVPIIIAAYMKTFGFIA